ncbi:PqqD family peptide modification chaperone [Novispirillum itersonii]|uniref:PqqD family protein n=1 Tax=Novispirillum itersonii TaxID=189 RepID=A0A7W9ZEX1_NOVIT|nr:PqqD family peptide modification chaperone [Novispirillum itersonii]MBB6210216.1 hypothetical protein [Novispirillum itersonii]
MAFSTETVFVRSPNPLTTEIDGELVMMDVTSGRYFTLDRIGTVIWGHLETPVCFGDLCQSLTERYDAPADTLAADVAALLTSLRDAGLVTLRSA